MKTRKVFSVYEIVMLYSGEVESVDRKTYGGRDPYREDRHFIWERSKMGWTQEEKLPDAINSTVLARDEKHAIKIVNEIRLKMIEYDALKGKK